METKEKEGTVRYFGKDKEKEILGNKVFPYNTTPPPSEFRTQKALIKIAWSAFQALDASIVTSNRYYFRFLMMGLERFVVSLKSKLRSLKPKKPYDKIDKSESMRVEMRSRKAQKLIAKTLKIADSPKNRSYAF